MTNSQPVSVSGLINGHIVIGRTFAETSTPALYNYGPVTVDHLTIWDRPLSEEETQSCTFTTKRTWQILKISEIFYLILLNLTVTHHLQHD